MTIEHEKAVELRSLASKLRELAEQCGAGKFPFGADQWPAHAAYEHAADMVAKLAGPAGNSGSNPKGLNNHGILES